ASAVLTPDPVLANNHSAVTAIVAVEAPPPPAPPLPNPPGTPACIAPVSLLTAGNFAVLAGSTVTNTGFTVVNGELGVWPGTAITGFMGIAPGGPGIVTGGTIHSADPVAQQAQGDLTAAYNDAAGRPIPTTVAGNIGGQTLPCG